MAEGSVPRPPRWFFTILTIGAFAASGLYLGIMRAEGPSTGHIVRSVGYGVFGLLAVGSAWQTVVICIYTRNLQDPVFLTEFFGLP